MYFLLKHITAIFFLFLHLQLIDDILNHNFVNINFFLHSDSHLL